MGGAIHYNWGGACCKRRTINLIPVLWNEKFGLKNFSKAGFWEVYYFQLF
jgi:hypothetical protein